MIHRVLTCFVLGRHRVTLFYKTLTNIFGIFGPSEMLVINRRSVRQIVNQKKMNREINVIYRQNLRNAG